jgi:hypothetical protein
MAYSLRKARKILKLVKDIGEFDASIQLNISKDSVKRACRLAEGGTKPLKVTAGKGLQGYVNDVKPKFRSDNRPMCIHPDIHAPYSHPDTIEFLKWVQEWRGCQERVVNVGDLLDFHAQSRFTSEIDAHNAVEEYKKALAFVADYSKAFPLGDMVLGNHDAIPQRAMKELGLLPSMLKDSNELYGLPEGWNIHPLYYVIDPDGWNVLVEHGIGSGGRYGCANTAKEKRCSYVMGHVHSAAAVIYSTNHNSTIFGMNVGCLVDSGSLAMRYGKYGIKKGVISCGVVYGGSHAEVITMDTWKNYKKWF